jgi:hypothetical protein
MTLQIRRRRSDHTLAIDVGAATGPGEGDKVLPSGGVYETLVIGKAQVK